jgi:hypothetical protein
MRLAPVGIALVVAVPMLALSGRAGACIKKGTEQDINSVLATGGDAVLCEFNGTGQGLFRLSGTIKFTTANQKLYTLGRPTGKKRALLKVVDSSVSVAIDGSGVSGIELSHVRIDGNTEALGFVCGACSGGNCPKPSCANPPCPPCIGDALINMGGTGGSYQTISHVLAENPRSWSTIHFFEGTVTPDPVSTQCQKPAIQYRPSCSHETLTHNHIRHAGRGYQYETNPDKSGNVQYVGLWADGISFACSDSVIEDNVIEDATDGAIVLFGAPGTLVSNNRIVNRTQPLFGGIHMVPYDPVCGNYHGTVVSGNTIKAESAFIRTGIPMGVRLWGCPNPADLDGGDGIHHGGTVTSNTVTGDYFGYGYPIDGVANWTVSGNVDSAKHVGIAPVLFEDPCADDFLSNAFAFQYDPQYTDLATSSLQSDYVMAGSLTTATRVIGAGLPQHCGRIFTNEGLYSGQGLASCNGQTSLNFQDSDGNLVLYKNGVPLWATNIFNQPESFTRNTVLVMEQLGNLSLYDNGGVLIWSTNTQGDLCGSGGHCYAGSYLEVTDYGDLLLISASGQLLWHAP